MPLMISLRSKIIISLILMSFISIALTALTARTLVLGHFQDIPQHPGEVDFVTNARAYYLEYGSWQAATETEDLFDFAQRKNQLQVLSVVTPEVRPPFPPPYSVIDLAGEIMLSPRVEDIGVLLSEEQLKLISPFMDGEEQIGYLYSEVRSALTIQQSEYLFEIENFWWVALLVVFVLSIPAGIILGRRVAGPIGSLDRAMRAMQPGSLEQQVPVTSNDELGHLTESFNKMSKDLSDAYKELEESRQKMEEMSLQDSLTLLPNRRSFDESASVIITQAYRHGRTCVLAMIDVDRFKEINDTYSHAKGDVALKQLAGVLRSNLREVDILARYGGEEFMVLFPETDLKTAIGLIERLRIFVSEYSWPDIDPELKITVSAGLVEVDVNDMSTGPLEKAINAADKKLYLAKDNGRNRTES